MITALVSLTVGWLSVRCLRTRIEPQPARITYYATDPGDGPTSRGPIREETPNDAHHA